MFFSLAQLVFPHSIVDVFKLTQVDGQLTDFCESFHVMFSLYLPTEHTYIIKSQEVELIRSKLIG